jgi:hypothetical protein
MVTLAGVTTTLATVAFTVTVRALVTVAFCASAIVTRKLYVPALVKVATAAVTAQPRQWRSVNIPRLLHG